MGRSTMVTETLDAVVERVRGLVAAGRRTMLGITGAPGAGKSTLVDTVEAELSDVAALVGMYGFHLADAELRRLGRRSRKGAPDTFDRFGYAARLARLRVNADPVTYAPLFDRDFEEPIASAVPVARDVPLVIIEGNYLLLDGVGWRSARTQLDVVWFLDLPADLRTQRLAARHQRYGIAPEEALDRATTGADGANARLAEATRDQADLVLRVAG